MSITLGRRGRLAVWAGVFVLLVISPAATGELRMGPATGPLRPADLEQLKDQRKRVAELARRHVGTPISRSLDDLRILQRLVDRFGSRDRRLRDLAEPGFPGRARIYELQALGVALGDVMVRNLGLEWVSFEDEHGRSRALRGAERATLVFPVTMISKRYEGGQPVNVRSLYDSVAAKLGQSPPHRRR